MIACDEIIDTDAKSYNKKTKSAPTNITCKTKSFHVLLAYLLITTALLIAVSNYCYLIRYKAKQKHLLPFPSKIKTSYVLIT